MQRAQLQPRNCGQMATYSVTIDDELAEASPMLGRMRLDGLTETAVPFAERVVLLWRRGAPTPDMSVETLTSVLKVWCISSSLASSCAAGAATSSASLCC